MSRSTSARIAKFLGKRFLLVAGAGLLLALAACDRPMEKAGKAVDDAVEKTGDKINEAVK